MKHIAFFTICVKLTRAFTFTSLPLNSLRSQRYCIGTREIKFWRWNRQKHEATRSMGIEISSIPMLLAALRFWRFHRQNYISRVPIQYRQLRRLTGNLNFSVMFMFQQPKPAKNYGQKEKQQCCLEVNRIKKDRDIAFKWFEFHRGWNFFLFLRILKFSLGVNRINKDRKGRGVRVPPGVGFFSENTQILFRSKQTE